MADDLERRVGRLEEYQSMIYQWLDEQRRDMKEMRQDMIEMRHGHEERMRKLEEHEGMIIQLLRAMDDRLDDHGDRLNAAGI